MNERDRENCKKKDPYDTREEAELMARQISRTTTSPELHVYECRVCGAFHFTSKPPREDE
jgi:hypothetical protein